jgi:hypothetical protein
MNGSSVYRIFDESGRGGRRALDISRYAPARLAVSACDGKTSLMDARLSAIAMAHRFAAQADGRRRPVIWPSGPHHARSEGKVPRR